MIHVLYLHTITYIFDTLLLLRIGLLSKNYLVMFAKAIENTMADNKHQGFFKVLLRVTTFITFNEAPF